jgi:hypothetical protein
LSKGELPRLSVPPLTTVWDTPRSISMNPSVTMNGWRLSRVMSTPWMKPTSAVNASAAGMATHSE